MGVRRGEREVRKKLSGGVIFKQKTEWTEREL